MENCVIITAAAGGLGKAFAAECASRGWNLCLVDIRAEGMQPLAEGLRREFGVQVRTDACDLSDSSARDALWSAYRSAQVRAHTLINVAGIEYEGLFAYRTVDELRFLMRLNMEAAVEMCNQFLRYRDPVQPPRIVLVSSLAGFYPMPTKAVYAASKRFLMQFGMALRQELRGAGGNVLCLCPAGLPTHAASRSRIEAQGVIGQLTTTNVGRVAAGSLRRLLAGRAVYIPGGINAFLSRLGTMLPPTWSAVFIWRRWSRVRRSMGAEE